ncbi:MAG: RNA methyltransferase [Firmicutes bacterium]|nr:RNA methyltransferase [Bacillota bacterium]
MPGKLYIALVHYPVYNKNSQEISTSVTNLDLHDIARMAATYGVERYFVVHPLEAQQRLVGEVLQYWREGFGSQYNPYRGQAFDRLQVVASVEEAARVIEESEEAPLVSVSTTARRCEGSVSFTRVREMVERKEHNFLLLFGTGWGLAQSVIDRTDYVLEPVEGNGDYNHLSVRSAVAIVLDRLLGKKWWLAPLSSG